VQRTRPAGRVATRTSAVHTPSVTRLAAIVAAALSIVAGIYLLTSQTVARDSYLEVIAHGIGIYFIGKGIYMGFALYRQAGTHETVDSHLHAIGGLLASRLPRVEVDALAQGGPEGSDAGAVVEPGEPLKRDRPGA
jgi:hypothetical protein